MKYTCTCLKTRNECAWHWATPVFMLRYVRFLSVLRRAARHFCACTHFLSWHKGETDSRTHSYTFTHLCTHTREHTLTLWYSLSFFLSFFLSLSHTQSAVQVHFVTLKWQWQFPDFFSLGTLAAFLIVGTWLWLQEERRIFSVVSVWYRVRRRR